MKININVNFNVIVKESGTLIKEKSYIDIVEYKLENSSYLFLMTKYFSSSLIVFKYAGKCTLRVIANVICKYYQ